MRALALFEKSLRENLRDWKVLGLTLTFAPFLVAMLYLYLDGGNIGDGGRDSLFAMYVPAFLNLTVVMLMFTAAASIIREKDKGTLVRLRLSNITSLEWLGAVTVVQVIIGMLAVSLTWLTAVALGYRGSGPLIATAVVCLISILAVVGISVGVAAWLRTSFDLMTVGCFPFFILMFFSGGMLPLPQPELGVVGGRMIHLNDLLPTTHTLTALSEILSRGRGLGDVVFELAAIAVLGVACFASGTWLFVRRHMRAAS